MRADVWRWLSAVIVLQSACGRAPSASSSTGASSSSAGGGGASTTSAGATGGAGGTPIEPAPFDWVGMIGTGQSLSVGATSLPVVSASQPYHNLKLLDASAPPGYDGVGDVLSVVPLTAPLRPINPAFNTVQYPDNIYGETPSEGLGNQVAALTLAGAGADWVTVQTNVGESGQGISVIEKGGSGKAYAASLYEVGALVGLAAQQGKTYGVGGVFLTHGETDADNVDYAARLQQLQADYAADIPALTGQMEGVAIFLSQQSTFPQALGPSTSTLAAWQLPGLSPGAFHCTGPKYQHEYAADKVHLTAPSSRRLGEKYGQVYHRVMVTKEGWQPLQPVAAKLSGNTVTVDFHVPVPPLAWEETVALPHQVTFTQWAAGRGFEVVDSLGAVGITGVEIQGSSVIITLAAPPAGQAPYVGYALFQDVGGFHGGEAVGRHGQLRDSDPFVGYSARTITCGVTQGSALVTALTAGDFADRGRTELASGAGLPKGAVVTQIAGDTMTLSAPWEGATGETSVTFRNDHRNYAVQFALAL